MTSQRVRSTLGLLFAVALLAPPAFASPASKPSRLGMCEACHGSDGRSRAVGTPHLAGQDEQYLVEAMLQYRDGRRAHAPMRAIMQAVPEAEVPALAAWYAAQPAQTTRSEE